MGQPVGQDSQADTWEDGQRDQEPLELGAAPRAAQAQPAGEQAAGRLRRRGLRLRHAVGGGGEGELHHEDEEGRDEADDGEAEDGTTAD